MDSGTIETHPWEPFIPEGARLLIMGTFPPGNHRWSIPFYYPNPINDFWRIIGLIFLGDKNALYDAGTRRFDIDAIKALLTEKHIAMNDTVRRARRLKGNASDKFLEVVEPVPLHELLGRMPECHTIATTGEKAAEIIASLTDTEPPRMGAKVVSATGLNIWRMPSTSRAYPLALDKKAEFYATLFSETGLLK